MSKSDDDKYKKEYENFINNCHKIALQHELYCNNNCLKKKIIWYPHTNKCIEFRKKHHQSFVECNSMFCLKQNEIHFLKPSYNKPINTNIITDLTYYSDSEEEI